MASGQWPAAQLEIIPNHWPLATRDWRLLDNLTHTLVGAAIAETGLKRRTALATWTLVLGANAPDIDVLAIPLGHGLDFRRGHTHGILALIVLPVILAYLMKWWHRRRGRRFGEPAFNFRWTLILAGIAVLTHPFLDWLNSYGMRWLMPFSGRWSAAEALFILDPVMWVLLGLGVWLGRREHRRLARDADRPARIALALTTAYVGLMMLASLWTNLESRRELAVRGATPDRVIVSPRPVSFLTREVIHERDRTYRFGRAALFTQPMLATISDSLPINAEHPAAQAARRAESVRRMLVWSRMPYFVVDQRGDRAVVRVDDARYSRGSPSWASVVVEVERGPDGWSVIPE